MWLLKRVRWIDRQISFWLFLFLWIFTRYNKVNGNPSAMTVIKARCYANCLTKNSATNETGKPCQTSACKECLIPCGTSFPDEATCKQSCNNSNSCLLSCEFLTQVKNFSSIFTGDGSTPSTPGIPTAVNRTLTSITLQWEPVENTTGNPVYMIEMSYSADHTTFTSKYLSEVFILPRATLTLQDLLCAFLPSKPYRTEYKPMLYKFKVAVLTENSSLNHGQQTNTTTLVKPDPVTNVTLDSLVYDAASNVDKIKLTASGMPSPEQKHLITKFGMTWQVDSDCKSFSIPRSKESLGPDPPFSMYIYQELKKCNHILRIHSLIGCSPSDPVILKYTYPGCQNITNFPKSECYKFDPPEAPIEDRVVRNIRPGGPFTAQADFTFKVTMIWDPPIYPYKNVTSYYIWMYKENIDQPTGFKFWKFSRSKITSLSLANLLPGTTYQIKARPDFANRLPWSEKRPANITTPDINPDEVKVYNLTAEELLRSPEGGSFVANISWEKPNFNYSTLTEYQFSYQVGSKNNTVETTNKTHFIISGILHGEQVNYRVTPIYKHKWVTGTEVLGNAKAPVPLNDEVKAQNIQVGDFIPEQGNGTFSVNFSWTGPVFNFTFRSYDIQYELAGYDAVDTTVDKNVKKPAFFLSGIRPKEIVSLKVIPVFDNKYIQKVETMVVRTAPEPDPKTVIVRNMTYGELNTSTPEQYDFLITWQKPLLKESSVRKYAITYERSGNPDRAKRLQFKRSQTSLSVFDLIPGDKLELEVTPEFVASVITGLPENIVIETPKPNDQEIQVQNLSTGLFVEDEESNTFSVQFTWKEPSFAHSKAHSYTVSYEFFGGYSREQLPCSPLVRDRSGCSKTGINQTVLMISGIFPREGISVKVTPIYSNIHITGQVTEVRTTAPEPKEELVKVIGLKRGKLVPGPNNTFGTTVRWQKPLFTHSEVKHYLYKVLVPTASQRRKRDNNLNTAFQTSGTNVTINRINRDDSVEFQVTPVFVVSAVTGKNEQIDLTWNVENDNNTIAKTLTPAEIGGLVVGLMLAALIAISLMLWCYRENQIQKKKMGLVSGKNAFMIDHWEVAWDFVNLEEELGEGAFGKVYKGTLKELTTHSRKLSVRPPKNALRKTSIKQSTGYTVAVKMLHDMADTEQRREFLEEIQLMKAVGTHKNIVNMLGCCTVEEPMFLLVEYVPYGDLLHYLRKRRGKVKEYLGDEYRGPYRSTYCETYILDGKPGGLSIQTTRNDRIYVNTPDAQKGDSGNIQILSFTQSPKTEDQIGTENKGLAKDNKGEASDEEEEEEDGLTPGDLLAFAWQVSEGMEYLGRKGFVHRDLAARNVLVGEHKIAKVADFGLTRHVYEEKVYHAKRNRKLPLKWMSIEAIFDQTFTTQSDVWAFGVVLWELVTLGGTPYPTINNRELLHLLKGGYRMEKPDICNDEIYEIMTECWMEFPEQRPNFTQIREKLEVMMQKDNPYLDFSVLDETRDYYNVPSFNSLMDESTDDELIEEEEDELLKEPSDDGNEEEMTPKEECSDMNELGTMSNAVGRLDKKGDDFGFGFNNNSFGAKDFPDQLNDIKVDFDAIEMSLYRPGNREIIL